MDMVRMISTSVHDYAGHRLAIGQEFDCERQHVDLMKKLGRAEIAGRSEPGQKHEARQSYQTRDLSSEAKPRRARRLFK